MYRERKSRTPAKTVTHFLKAVYEKWPGVRYQRNHRAKPNNRVKPIIQELTRKVKRGQYEEVQSFRDHAQGIDQLEKAIVDYIDYYNNRRIKLKLNGLSPVQYRIQTVGAA